MAADNFAPCRDDVLIEEGGKVDDPRDPGGRTNKGVTQTSYNAYRRRKGLATRDVYLMTPAECDEIYRTGYWTPAGCDALPAGLDLAHFDAAVNSGVARARKWLATAQTKTAVSDQIRAYTGARLSFQEALRTWRTFGKGWRRRDATIEAKALAMAVSAGHVSPAAIAAVAAAHAKRATVAGVVAHAATVAAAGAGLAPALVTVAHPAAAASVGVAGALAALVAGFTRWTSGLRAEAIRTNTGAA